MNVRRYLVLLGALVSFACSSAPASPSDDPAGLPTSAAKGAGETAAGAGAGAGASPPVSGSFGGSYSVPVASELTAAATFDVNELTWTVAGGVATLAYKLPRALVGKSVRVVFSGPFDPAAGRATLTGAPGTAECSVTAVAIVCSENMQGLLPLQSNMEVVEKLATNYPGPPADRLAVATQFAGDPIGIATLDLTRPGVTEPTEPAEAEHDP